MKNFISILFLLYTTVFFAQNRYDVSNSGVKKSKGLMRISKNGDPLTGIVFGNYKNGQIAFEDNYENGIANGPYKQWNKNGQLILEINYKNGLKEGLERTWYDNGQLEWEVTYKGGKKDGYEKIYTKLGKLETEDFYQNGKRQIKD
jgi:antitoxin component YwqK of YwqJK toxin-antitoxin module